MTVFAQSAATTATWSASARLQEDYHVHSIFSDGVSTVAENVRVARQRGLRRVCLVDHVRRTTSWVPQFVSAVRQLREVPGIDILAGVEAKILDRAGRLDLPAAAGAITGIDLVLIADHQFPAELGPVQPEDVRAALASGELSPAAAIECLVEATANALGLVEATANALGLVEATASAGGLVEATASAGGLVRRPVLAHLFSVLPKIGLDESSVPDRLLDLLADRARVTGAMIEVNEKWSCPSARTLRAFASAGVPVVASTDSHDCKNVGAYSFVARTLAAVFPGTA